MKRAWGVDVWGCGVVEGNGPLPMGRACCSHMCRQFGSPCTCLRQHVPEQTHRLHTFPDSQALLALLALLPLLLRRTSCMTRPTALYCLQNLGVTLAWCGCCIMPSRS